LNIGDLENMHEVMSFFQTYIWAFIDAAVTIITVLGVVYNILQNKKQYKKQSELIKISIIKHSIKKGMPTKQESELPTYIIRKHFTRAEVKGILRELHRSERHYEIADISKPDFLKSIYEIQKGTSSDLKIKIYDDDYFEYPL